MRRTRRLRNAGQCGHQAQLGLLRMARGPRTNVHAFVATFGASAETPEPSSQDKANTSLPRATPGAGRPSAGGRLTCGCSRARSSSPPSPRVLARWPKKQSLVPPRSARAPGPHFCSAVAAPSPWARVRPNPSLERTRTGKAPWPRGSQVYHPPRGQAASPARAAQLKR